MTAWSSATLAFSVPCSFRGRNGVERQRQPRDLPSHRYLSPTHLAVLRPPARSSRSGPSNCRTDPEACRRMAGRTEAMGCRAIRMRCQRRGARTVHSHRICDAASREPADAQRCGSNRPFADGYHDAFRARHFVGSGLAWCAARRRSRCGVTRIHRRYRRYRGFALPRRLAPSGR